jgi:NADH-quinone oxidoreductase subunit L
MESTVSTALSMPIHSSVLWLIPFLPLFGAILNGATGRWVKSTKLVDAIALGAVALSFLLVLCSFAQLLGQAPANRSLNQTLWTWFDLGGARVLGGITQNTMSWAYKFDPAKSAMTAPTTASWPT